MHKALRLRDDIDRLYVSRKEGGMGGVGGRGLASIHDRVDTSIRLLEDCIKKQRKLITATRNSTHYIKIKKTQQQRENKNGKKNNCMDMSSDKQAKSHTRKLRRG